MSTNCIFKYYVYFLALSNEISSTANKYIQNQDIQIEVNNTSIILE